MRSISRHLPHYLSLIGILFVAFLAFIIFSYDKGFQIAVLIATAVSYVVWGIIHHWLHRDLYPAVVVEYFVVATLGLVIVFSLLFRA